MTGGILVFSPLTHNAPLVESGLPRGWQYWKVYDRTLVERCDRLIVLTLSGWDTSEGVRQEIAIAKECGLAIDYLDPAQVGVEMKEPPGV